MSAKLTQREQPGSAITINNLNLRLPPGFERRAASIARNIARELSRQPIALSGDYGCEQLNLPPLTVAHGETNSRIARRIASAIAQQITTRANNNTAAQTAPQRRRAGAVAGAAAGG